MSIYSHHTQRAGPFGALHGLVINQAIDGWFAAAEYGENWESSYSNLYQLSTEELLVRIQQDQYGSGIVYQSSISG